MLICLTALFHAFSAWAMPLPAQPQLPHDIPPINDYSGWKAKQERVIILHDLFDMSIATSTLARGFRDAGYKVDNLGYNPLAAAREAVLPAMIADIYDRMRHYSEKGDETVHFVCSSLGCVLAHGLIYEHRPKKLGRVLMLGNPAYALWLVEGRDVAGHALQQPQLGTANRIRLQRYLDNPIAYPAAALTGNAMEYPQRTDIVFALDEQPYLMHSIRLPAHTEAISLRVLPATQHNLLTDETAIAEAVHYIDNGSFR